MKQHKMEWMAIVVGAGMLYGTATAFAQEAKPPAAPAADPKAGVKPAEQIPQPESPLLKLNMLSRESKELKKTIDAKEAKLLLEKPELKAKLDAADEKLKALQEQIRVAQEEKTNIFSEADPDLKGLYERQAKIRAEMSTFFRRPPPAVMKPKAGEGLVPGAEALKPQLPAPGGAAPATK